MSAGFRILERTRKVNEQDVKNFAAIPVANISDSMARMSAAANPSTSYGLMITASRSS